ncbi:unnamed protein product [Microthlaspi erraticum]|uniref:Uncharacterized protein n=1 Tax=Microthlaspi erraticum TaxID=1685480 RepID=A0A6D2I4G2_9BRAS|nr:unnamed protein product [Microthlaspi erraticum]
MAPEGIRYSKRQAGVEATPVMSKMKRMKTKKVVDVTEEALVEGTHNQEHVSEEGDNTFEEYEDGEASENNEDTREDDVEDEVSAEDAQTQQSGTTKKKTRGPTKMRKVAKHHDDKVQVEFTSVGEHVGVGSVTLSSFLGPLVREHVSVLLDDWRHLDDELRDTLWEEVQGRFNLTEEWQKESVLKQMGGLWKCSKSRLTKQVRSTRCKMALKKLKPTNVQSVAAWNNWVKHRVSPAFKSEKYRQMRRSQIPHTTSRKGMVRLAHEMKKKSSDPRRVTRSKVWVAGHTHADGTPVIEEFAETIEKVKSIDSELESTANVNIREDAVSQVLGKDKPGRLRGMGKGFTFTKLAFLQARDSHVQKLEATQAQLLSKIDDLTSAFNNLTGRNTSQRDSDNVSRSEHGDISKGGVRCHILDWCSSDDVVIGEEEFCSAEPMYKIGRIPLGPNAAAVMVKSAVRPEAYLWRPSSTILTLGDTMRQKVAWPFEKIILDSDMDSPKTNIEDPKDLVDNIPLGPNSAIVKVAVVMKEKAFLWRPSAEMSELGDALDKNIAWPMHKVQLMSPAIPLEETTRKSPLSASNSTSSSKGVKQRCILLDCDGSGETVAQGRISSTDPADKVHFVPLGINASKVWIEVCKSDDARVWRPNSEVEFVSDDVGTTVAWPNDKLILL